MFILCRHEPTMGLTSAGMSAVCIELDRVKSFMMAFCPRLIDLGNERAESLFLSHDRRMAPSSEFVRSALGCVALAVQK
jgi:hypothetical protein